MRRVRFLVLVIMLGILAALPSQTPSLTKAAATDDHCEACYSQYTTCMSIGYPYEVCCPAYNDCLGDDSLCGYCPEP